MRQMGAIIRHAAEDRPAQIEAPTLILTGNWDLLAPAENSRRLARAIRGARLVEYSGVEVVRALQELWSSRRM